MPMVSQFFKRHLLYLVLLAGLLATACGAAVTETEPAALKVVAEPANTSVYVNDRFIGSARVLAVKPAAMRPGVKFFTFTAPGYFPHDIQVTLPSGTTSISIKLRQIPP